MSSLPSTLESRASAATRRPSFALSSLSLRRARLPSPARVAALETRELMTWAEMLARKRGMLLTTLTTLTIPQLCQEIALFQWELAIDKANAVYHWPDKKTRPHEIGKLRASPSEIDRYAYGLIETWSRLDRERRP
jgi:hypothetical protein